ncbi:MAG: 3-deoxy-8-phosphooctulonate synthase [candidate division KSB1 bacterium]|nr:3-deoxy-8-phosphooctulonate synthase [candidate division KSB1 bacterium]MDZ7276051.1 3-deoxy-8-phosphooctulonate synthase [candidate division KSB1 bacterium]MDZ7285667.1 3-deoxy-8-phosphooctulonate synthase [candidate division KSB1 bacterium]MDZ7298699.1 3-deoxy-8-phosphooctulonate synthase [candidate division KSB1 bacterium]MDZ7307552.1 3-deoxy-8-phosphooctulonate synthase [candidate division KSB1 bacterium]
MTRTIEIGKIKVGGEHPLVLICGPCVIEDEKTMMTAAERICNIAARVGLPLIFKSSYLKDNRSSELSYQGPGLRAGLALLRRIKEAFQVPVLSDIHDAHEAAACAEVLDVIQIPAYLCMQTTLTLAVAKTGRVVNVKKGQFLHPADLRNVIGKIERAGNHNIILTERGACHGYHDLVVDMRALVILRELGYPVMFDPTHAVRVYGLPSSDPAGGRPQFVPALTRAALAAGCDALFLEAHPNPAEAKCDAASQWPIAKLEDLLVQAKAIADLTRKFW